MKKLVTLLVCGLLAFSMAFTGGMMGGAVADQVYTVKISTQNAEGTPMVKTFRQLADSLMEKSNGRLKVDIYPSGVLGSDEDLIEQALQGVNVVVLTDASRMSNYVPDMPCMRNMGCMISWRRAC